MLILLGEKISSSSLSLSEDGTSKIPHKTQNNSMSNAVKVRAAGTQFGPKGSMGESSLH